MSTTRSWLYRIARALGDLTSIRKDRILQRAHNRVVGRGAAKVMRRIWR